MAKRKRNPETVGVKVEDVRVGDRVDLESCPHLHADPSAAFEYAEVVEVERETPGCVRIGYEGLGAVGYEVGTLLQVKRLEPVEVAA